MCVYHAVAAGDQFLRTNLAAAAQSTLSGQCYYSIYYLLTLTLLPAVIMLVPTRRVPKPLGVRGLIDPQVARERYPVTHALCVHREGHLQLGDLAVWVGVSSPHRDEAFQAARMIIDEIKVRLPIWKKEHYVDGDSGWVNCERCAAHGHAHS